MKYNRRLGVLTLRFSCLIAAGPVWAAAGLGADQTPELSLPAAFASILPSALQARRRASPNIDAYVGPALFSRNSHGSRVEKQPGAAIERETIYVAPVKKSTTRYVFNTDTSDSYKRGVIFTLYKDSDGNWYSYSWDRSHIRSEQDFADYAADKHDYNFSSDSWVPLMISGRKVTGVFYPGDADGEIKFTITLGDKSIEIKEWEHAQAHLLTLPSASSTYRFDITH